MSFPIFVVGCPRSGTTILRELIGQHSDVRDLYHETFLFCDKDSLKLLVTAKENREEAFERFSTFFWNRLYTRVNHNKQEKHEPRGVCNWCNPKETYKAFRELEYEYLNGENELAVRRFLDKIIGTSFVEKTPFHGFHTDIIRKIYPDSLIFLIERDAKSCAKSLSLMPWRWLDTYEKNFEYVKKIKVEMRNKAIKENAIIINLAELEDIEKIIVPLRSFGLSEEGFTAIRLFHKNHFNKNRIIREV